MRRGWFALNPGKGAKGPETERIKERNCQETEINPLKAP